jgi:ABC-type molybdate transport system substrate-binding protein
MRFLFLFFFFIFLGCEPSERKIPTQTINIAVSANMQFAMREIATLFEEKEKIKVKNETIIDFEKHFWDPMIELSIMN